MITIEEGTHIGSYSCPLCRSLNIVTAMFSSKRAGPRVWEQRHQCQVCGSIVSVYTELITRASDVVWTEKQSDPPTAANEAVPAPPTEEMKMSPRPEEVSPPPLGPSPVKSLSIEFPMPSMIEASRMVSEMTFEMVVGVVKAVATALGKCPVCDGKGKVE